MFPWLAVCILLQCSLLATLQAIVLPHGSAWRVSKHLDTSSVLDTNRSANGSIPDPVTNKQPASRLSRYSRVHIFYQCPRSGYSTRYFDLGVEYTGGDVDTIAWKSYTNVDGFSRRQRRDRRPIKATAVFYHDMCPPNQAIDHICSYHFEGHLTADIYTHFIALEMVVNVMPHDLRAPFIRESCVDMSRRPSGEQTCGAVLYWQLCSIRHVVFEVFHPPPNLALELVPKAN